MPRHQTEAEDDWFLAKEIPSGARWFQAEQALLLSGEQRQLLKMNEVFDKIRRDLGNAWVAWYPQKWTTMVEGRPVQVPRCILPLRRSRTPAEQNALDMGSSTRTFTKRTFFPETCMSEAIPIHVMLVS